MAVGQLKIRGVKPELTPRRKSFVDFLNQVRGADPRNPRGDSYTCRTVLEKHYGAGQVEKAAMSETSGMVGGYLVPTDYTDKLLFTIAEESFIYPRATVIPMYSAELQAPRIDAETAPAVTGISSLLGSIQFKWGMEQAPAETEPTFRQATFHAWDLLGYCTVSNQWLQDAGAIQPTSESPRPEADPLLKAEDYLIRLFGRAAAWYAEYAFLQGMGAGQRMPLGILKAPGSFLVNRAGANAIAIADIVGMTSALLPYSWSRAIWATSPTALAQIQQLTQYFINVDLGDMHKMRPKPCGLLSTMPLFITDKLPALGGKGDLVLFDPSLYIIAQRMQVVVDVSPDDKFATNQTVYRIWLRLDGMPINSSTITLQDTTTKVSPFVVLV